MRIELRGVERINSILKVLGVTLGYGLLFVFINIILLVVLNPHIEVVPIADRQIGQTISTKLVILLLPITAIVEELLFRKAPDFLVRKTVGRIRKGIKERDMGNKKVVISFILMFAIINALVHVDVVTKGSLFEVMKYWIIQGVNGCCLGYVFIKYGVFGSFISHFIFDLVLVVLGGV